MKRFVLAIGTRAGVLPLWAAFLFTLTLLLASALHAVGGGSGAISLTALNNPYTQDFNSLAVSGSTNSLALNGWYLDEAGSSSSNNGQYRGSTGSDNAG